MSGYHEQYMKRCYKDCFFVNCVFKDAVVMQKCLE